MAKVTICSIVLVLSFAATVCSTVLPPTVATLNNSTEGIPPTYHLVTAPSTNKKRVDAMCIKFLSLIPKAKLIPKTQERTVYRLVVNSFDKLESAKKRRIELSQQGIATFVMAKDTGYSVIAGSQFTEALAIEEQNQLAAKNIMTTIQELRVPLKEWQMKSTESFAVRDAVIMASKLAKIGVITTLEPAVD